MAWVEGALVVLFAVLGVWMLVTFYCQMQALRFVRPGFDWHYRKAVRKWQFDMAREFLTPEGLPWLGRVTSLIQAGTVLIGIAAFAAVGFMLWGSPPPV